MTYLQHHGAQALPPIYLTRERILQCAEMDKKRKLPISVTGISVSWIRFVLQNSNTEAISYGAAVSQNVVYFTLYTTVCLPPSPKKNESYWPSNSDLGKIPNTGN